MWFVVFCHYTLEKVTFVTKIADNSILSSNFNNVIIWRHLLSNKSMVVAIKISTVSVKSVKALLLCPHRFNLFVTFILYICMILCIMLIRNDFPGLKLRSNFKTKFKGEILNLKVQLVSYYIFDLNKKCKLTYKIILLFWILTVSKSV